MTALVDWRDDADLPSRTVPWWTFTVVMALVAVVVAAVVVVGLGSVSNISSDLCRLHEAREGLPELEKVDVPAVGETPRRDWVPPRGVRVRLVQAADAAKGTVVDITRCGRSGQDTLEISVAR